jgi:predicted MPP superfamily phosphohydrolase
MPLISRRGALRTLAAVAAGTATGAIAHGYLWERHDLQLLRTDLRVAGLVPEFEGLRIGFVTDLHLSELVPPEDIRHALALIAGERPDLIILGGDYVSYQDLRYAEPVADLLADVRAPLGVIAILGNHDDDRVVPAALSRKGITVLKDARTRLTRGNASLEIAGVRFWTKKQDEIATVVAGASAPVLLVAHDPRRVVEAAALGISAVLSGHTHGGQVVLPGLGAPAAHKFPVAAGHFSQKGTELFVSRGVGTVILPIRINCPPDVTLVTLRRRELGES